MPQKQYVRQQSRAMAKTKIKALGHRRRVWLRRDCGERLPFGQALTTLRFGPKRCYVRVASGPGKGDEWRIPYTDLAIEKPTDMEISLNRGVGRSTTATSRPAAPNSKSSPTTTSTTKTTKEEEGA